MASANFPSGFCCTRFAVPFSIISSPSDDDEDGLEGVYALQSTLSNTSTKSSVSTRSIDDDDVGSTARRDVIGDDVNALDVLHCNNDGSSRIAT